MVHPQTWTATNLNIYFLKVPMEYTEYGAFIHFENKYDIKCIIQQHFNIQLIIFKQKHLKNPQEPSNHIMYR